MNLKQMRIGDFRGVDFSGNAHGASTMRNVTGANWIRKDGINHKRNGWEQVFPSLLDSSYPYDGHINGMFPYKTASGTEVLVVTDKKAYRMHKTSGVWGYEILQNPSTPDAHSCYDVLYGSGKITNLSDRLLMAAEDDKYIYFPAGSYFCYDKTVHRLYELNASNPGMTAEKAYKSGLVYIPTTTIGIAPTSEVDTRTSLDAVNLLTPYRANKLSFKYHSSTETYMFVLDGKPVTGDCYVVDGYGHVYAEYSLTTEPNGFHLNGNSIYFSNNIFEYTDDIFGPSSYYENNYDVEMTVVFKVSDYTERIGGNQAVTTFGIGGYSDRMFIGGASNTVYFSDEDNYTYFPDIFTANVGGSNSKVSGFLRLADGVLSIFKEANGNDPTIYFMTGRRDIADDGTVTPVFTVSPGNITETPITPFVTGTLISDSLIASKKGVFAITLSENVVASQRTAQNRSHLINAKLRKTNLSNAVSVVYQGKYYLAADGEVFIADSDQKWKPGDSQWWQYEWYYFDHCPVRCWCVVDDVLMFGTEDGTVCAFDNETLYEDISLMSVNAGTITSEYNTISYSETIKTYIKNGVLFSFASSGVYGRENVSIDADVAEYGDDDDVVYRVYTNNENVYRLENDSDKWSLYLYASEQYYECTNVSFGGEFDWFECTIPDFSGTIDKESDKFYLFRNLFGEPLYIVGNTPAAEGGTFKASYKKGGDAIDIEALPSGSLPGTPLIRFINITPVVATWKTPVLDMGTNTHRKTLLRLTICADCEYAGDIHFGYETKNRIKDIPAMGETYFGFDPIDFTDFAIASKFASSYTVPAMERGYNYIQFYFKSESNTDCVVHDMTATYRIIAENRGVR